MSFEGFAAIVLGVNLFCALVCSFLAGRGGHDPFPWALIGAVLGPIGLVALVASRRRPSPAPPDGAAGGTVLIATDGSESSLGAVEHYIRERRGGGPVTLLSVLPVERREAAPAELEADIESRAGEAKRRLERAGISCRMMTAFGDPATEIIRVAIEGHYRHIFMGRRGRGGVAKLLLGSVSQKVLKEAPVPVTVSD